jgi:Cupin domain
MTGVRDASRWRVIETGRDPSSGASTIADERRPDTVTLATGRGLCTLWQTDEPGRFPGPHGLRLWVFVIPPDSAEPQTTPLHATATIDLGFVLDGSVVLEMEDGSTAVLHQGDAFVQPGTAHQWRNTTDEQAVIGLVVIGTEGI